MSIFNKVWGKVKGWFTKNQVVIEEVANTAVKVVNTIKAVVDSPFINLAINFTASDVDDKVLAKVKEVLPKIASEILVAQRLLKPGQSTDAIMADLISFLKGLNMDARADQWVEIAGKLTQALADGNISLVEAISISQDIYNKLNHK